MSNFSRRVFLTAAAATTTAACISKGAVLNTASEKFVCPPCGCALDETEFNAPGRCPDCDMTLAPKEEHDLGFEPAALLPGAGCFTVAGGIGRREDIIRVHYYMPRSFSRNAPILLVLPGAGRNSDDYRNTWIETARRKNVLVAALGYPEETYDFAAYHMGGVIKNLTFVSAPSRERGVIRLRDEDIVFDLNPVSHTWLFNDFDRVFGVIAQACGSERAGYDIFGHSAGGQILHRLALLFPPSRARRIIAANAGFYTLPDFRAPPPTGVKGLGVTQGTFARAFSRNVTILLGEHDNSDTAGGTMLHTPKIDEQGLGRLTRGRTFYTQCRDMAARLETPFRWGYKVVPNVGHDYRAMSAAAAQALYSATYL